MVKKNASQEWGHRHSICINGDLVQSAETGSISFRRVGVSQLNHNGVRIGNKRDSAQGCSAALKLWILQNLPSEMTGFPGRSNVLGLEKTGKWQYENRIRVTVANCDGAQEDTLRCRKNWIVRLVYIVAMQGVQNHAEGTYSCTQLWSSTVRCSCFQFGNH